MKINILEISKDKEFDLEIILVDNLKKIKSKEDKELLEKLDFKAKDESVVLLAEKRKSMLVLKIIAMIVWQLQFQVL